MKKWQLFWLICGVLLGTAVFSQPAFAHAELVAIFPTPGSSVDKLSEIRLTFSDAVSADSQIQLLQDFVIVADLQPMLNLNNDKELLAIVPPLPDGVYTVSWTAVSADGHPLSGSYSLGINSKPPLAKVPWYFSTAGLIGILLGSLGAAIIFLRRWLPSPQ